MCKLTPAERIHTSKSDEPACVHNCKINQTYDFIVMSWNLCLIPSLQSLVYYGNSSSSQMFLKICLCFESVFCCFPMQMNLSNEQLEENLQHLIADVCKRKDLKYGE